MKTRFQEIVQSCMNKTVVCYGIPLARPYFDVDPKTLLVRHGIIPAFFADTFRFGEEYCGQKIISPDELLTLDKRESIVVVIYCSAVHEVYKYLKNKGLRGKIFCIPSFIEEAAGSAFLLPDEKIDAFYEDTKVVRSKLSDDISKEILDCIVEGRKNLSPESFTKAFDITSSISGKQSFFIKEVLARFPKRGIAFIDCGAYDGDTIHDMIELGIPLSNTICFEPDIKNFALLLERIKKLNSEKHISAVQAGVWSKTTKLYFNSAGTDSSHVELDEVAGDQIDVISLDDFLEEQQPVDMIKMDIEGSEMEALRGAIKTIKRKRPILAICLYHKFYDLTQIPMYLMEQLENYDFLLRQHDGMAETILYGLPR